MKPDRWRQIDQILQAALDRDPRERSAFLEEACAEDASLLGEVESLIKSHDEAQSFIEAPLLEDATKMMRERPVANRLIGAYKIIREIGHGGMGTVFLASRADEQYRKAVAIKLIRRGMDTDSILSRFRHERQILASLDHPNIARLLEGGTTEDGLPYFVMEYIEGQTVDQYCDTHRLTTAERLKLFRTVCSAVHYAHQNLVVHRDIKPSNILVTAEGIPKLLDFGIAKLLKPEMYAQTIAPTETMVRPMTPDYASPEQVRSQPITTATDVYSLGVLLYELLTGRRPYRIRSSHPEEMEKAICEQEPERPSTAINRTETVSGSDGGAQTTLTPELVSKTREGQPDKLRRKLAGDLDNIVLMAMRKEAQRRYASVEQFSEDIRRHLEGLPVIARKDTFGYRTQKFIQRHKVAAAVGTAFAIFIIASVIAIVLQSARATRERDRAARERDKAQQVSALLVNLFKVSDPNEARGKTITAREVLDQGAERIERELSGQPEVQATLMDTIGEVYQSLGLFDKAQSLLEKALKSRREVFGNEHPQVAESMGHLAMVLHSRDDNAAAEAMLREALAMRRKLLGNEHPDVATSLDDLGEFFDDTSDYAQAEPLLRESVRIRRKVLGNESREVADSLANLGGALYRMGDYDAAEGMHREALAIHRKLFGEEHPLIATDLNMLAFVVEKKGDLATAESYYRQALAMRRRVYGNEHPQVAESLNNLAWTLNQKGNHAEAEPLYRESLAIRRRVFGDESSDVAQSLNNLAKTLSEGGNSAEAEPLLRESLAIRRHLLGDEHPDVARTMNNLAVLLYDKGDYASAEPMLRHALQIRRKKWPNGHEDVANTLIELGRLLIDRGNPQEAEALLREGLEIRRNKLAAGHWQIAEAESVLGGCLTALKRYDEAEPLLAESCTVIRAKRGEQDIQTQRALARLVKLYTVLGKPDKVALYRSAGGNK